MLSLVIYHLSLESLISSQLIHLDITWSSPLHLGGTQWLFRTWYVHDGNHAVICPRPFPQSQTSPPLLPPNLCCLTAHEHSTEDRRQELFLIMGSSSRPLQIFYLCLVCLSSNYLISHSNFSRPWLASFYLLLDEIEIEDRDLHSPGPFLGPGSNARSF